MNKLITILILLTISLASVKAQNIERYKKHHDKGRLLILEGKYQQAISQLDTAINIMPYYARIFQDRGYAYMQLKNYKLAIRDFDHVLKKQPYLNEVKLQRGMALYHLNYLDDAERDLLSIRKARPDKNFEAEYYLESINQEKELIRNKEQERINELRYRAETHRLDRARHREDVIWNTVVPLAFWTTVFLTW
jgi:tetratricopeptide (TPR) repeat protein